MRLVFRLYTTFFTYYMSMWDILFPCLGAEKWKMQWRVKNVFVLKHGRISCFFFLFRSCFLNLGLVGEEWKMLTIFLISCGCFMGEWIIRMWKTVSIATILTCSGYCYWFRIGRLLVGDTEKRFLVSFGNWPSLSHWILNKVCNQETCPRLLNVTWRLISFLITR